MSKRPAIGFDLPLPSPGRALRRGHWSTDGLRSLLLPNTGTPSVDVHDMARHVWIQGFFNPNVNNVPTPHGLMNFTHVNDGMIVASDSSLVVPTNRVTVLVVHRKTDLTLRNSNAFAVLSATVANWCQCAIPWGNGIAFWEFGDGAGFQLSSPTAIPLTTDAVAWAFVAGQRGMAMYRNGALLASSANIMTRTSTTAPLFVNNGGGGSNSRGDFAEYSFFALLDAEWNAQQVQEWTDNQDIMFASPSWFAHFQAVSADPVSRLTRSTVAVQRASSW